jgi:hypothetical protein
MCNRDDLAGLQEASPEDYAHMWSLGDINDALIIREWTGAAIGLELRTTAGPQPMPSIVLALEGVIPGFPYKPAKQTIVIPFDIAKDLGTFIVDHVGKIERNDRARIIDMRHAPKEP